MKDPEVMRQLHAMLDAHTAAFEAIRRTNASLREANTANGVAIAAIGEANTAIGAAFDAHEDVIAAALLANQAAIDVLHALNKDS